MVLTAPVKAKAKNGEQVWKMTHRLILTLNWGTLLGRHEASQLCEEDIVSCKLKAFRRLPEAYKLRVESHSLVYVGIFFASNPGK